MTFFLIASFTLLETQEGSMFTSIFSKVRQFTQKYVVVLQILFILFCVLWVSETAVAQSAAPLANDLRISQVYGGGGNSGASYTHDFVEIFNSSGSAISLNGLSLQYTSADTLSDFGDATNKLTELPNVMLQPGQYYLVQQNGGINGIPLPTPDVIDDTPIAMAAENGKVVIVTGTTSLGCNGGSTPCTSAQMARIIDMVGYGSANFYEGTAAAPSLNNTTAALRNANGCIDTNNNVADFTAGTPLPRNTSSPTHSCVTFNTINLDGTITDTEWERGLLGTANGTTFGITWDDDFWYFGVRGGFSSTNFFIIGIDVDPDNETSSNSGGTANRCGANFPTENKPDYILVNRQDGYLRESWGWNGSGWDQASFNPTETSDYDFSGGGGGYEVKLKKSTVFNSNEDSLPVGFYLWLANDSCQFFNAWPPENNNAHNPNSQFLYAHTRYATTDANRAPDTYGSRIAWAANTLSNNSTSYNFFGEDDASANPWLQMTTTGIGAGGASCTVRAKLVANNAFINQPFTGINRFIDFTLTNCTDLEVDVQMRYETSELHGIDEAATAFYRCATPPCSASWNLVSAGTVTRDVEKNNLSLTAVPQTKFSSWTISDNNKPTAVSLQSFTGESKTIPVLLITTLLFLLFGSTALILKQKRR